MSKPYYVKFDVPKEMVNLA